MSNSSLCYRHMALTGGYGARRILRAVRVRGPWEDRMRARTLSIRSMYGPRTGLLRTSTCLLRAKYRRKPVSESCASSIFSRVIRHPYGSKILLKAWGPTWHAARVSLILVHTGPVNCPGVHVIVALLSEAYLIPRFMVSDAPIMETASIMLLQILAAWMERTKTQWPVSVFEWTHFKLIDL